jgi:hypothetical protein
MMTELNLNRDDLIKLLKFTLARVNELENIISENEQLTEAHTTISAAIPRIDTSYPPNWPYGHKSTKTMENVFGYYQGVEPGDYE